MRAPRICLTELDAVTERPLSAPYCDTRASFNRANPGSDNAWLRKLAASLRPGKCATLDLGAGGKTRLCARK